MQRLTLLAFSLLLLAISQVSAESPAPAAPSEGPPELQWTIASTPQDPAECTAMSTRAGGTEVTQAFKPTCGPCGFSACQGREIGSICGFQGSQAIRCWSGGPVCGTVPETIGCVCARFPP